MEDRLNYSDKKVEELIEILKGYYKKNGKFPSAVTFQNDKNYPHPSKFIKYFGSWSNALKAAKLKKQFVK